MTNPKIISAVEPQTYIEFLEVPPNMIVPEGETYENNVQLTPDIESIKKLVKAKAKEHNVTVPLPVIIEIVRCESSWNQSAYNDKNNNASNDSGLFQLNSVHDNELNRLGLDKHDLHDNIEFAMILMKQNGTRDWYSSEHCWSKV